MDVVLSVSTTSFRQGFKIFTVPAILKYLGANRKYFIIYPDVEKQTQGPL